MTVLSDQTAGAAAHGQDAVVGSMETERGFGHAADPGGIVLHGRRHRRTHTSGSPLETDRIRAMGLKLDLARGDDEFAVRVT